MNALSPDARTVRRAMSVLKRLPPEKLEKAIDSLVQLLPPSEFVSEEQREQCQILHEAWYRLRQRNLQQHAATVTT